jgi:predicted small secreted protein
LNSIKAQLLLVLILVIVTSFACKTLAGNGKDVEPTMDPALQEQEVVVENTPAPVEQDEQTVLSPTEIEPSAPKVKGAGSSSNDSEFPLPADVQNFTQLGEAGINFQTEMTLEEALDFYRRAFHTKDLMERELLTVIDEDVFSMVFDGAPDDKAIVIQGVYLDDGLLNINIRCEDV